jgi:streptogramin lyase
VAGRRRAIAAAAVVLLVAGAFAATKLLGGDDGTDSAAPTGTSTTPSKPKRAKADPSLYVATRPNSITIANGQVWVLSTKSGEIVVLDAQSSEGIDRLPLGEGGSAVKGGFGSVWAVKRNTRTLIRFDETTRRRTDSTTINYPGQPVSVAVGEGAVWIGVRKSGRRDGTGESVIRVDPGSLGQQAIAVPGGVEGLAVGKGAVWVSNRTRDSVVRIDARHLDRQKEIPVGKRPKGIAVGYDYVWVANSASDSVTRINPRGYQRKTIALDDSPRFVSTGGGSVWVTATESDRLIRIDPKKRKVRERVKTGRRPFALDVTRGRSVWVTLLNANAVQRVRFSP